MKARLVHAHRRHAAQPAHQLAADRDAAQQVRAAQAMALGRREHGRHDDRTGMHRTALVGVVEILAVRRGAVDEGRRFGAQRESAGIADDSARPRLLDRRDGGLDIVGVARRHAQPGDVEQQALAERARRGVALRVERRQPRRDLLGDGFPGQ